MSTTPKTKVTHSDIVDAFVNAGVQSTDALLIHMSLSSIGYVVGGAPTFIRAAQEVVQNGTLVMPTHTADNTDPANWQFPPVPEAWWETIRAETPAFDPDRTPSRKMGVVAELFRTWPEVQRSDHPVGSFAASGRYASQVLDRVPLQPEFGAGSTIERLYDLDAKVALIGVGHDRNTSLHLAEYRADFKKTTVQEGCSMLVQGQRKWVPFEMMALETDDFEALGQAFAETGEVQSFVLGDATVRLMSQRSLVDFAVDWMSTHRA